MFVTLITPFCLNVQDNISIAAFSFEKSDSSKAVSLKNPKEPTNKPLALFKPWTPATRDILPILVVYSEI